MNQLQNPTLKTLTGVLLATALVPSLAVAQDDVAASTEKTITPYGLLGSYIYFTDSQEDDALDFESVYLRPGFKISEGIATGRLELDISGAGTAGVRHANVGLKLETGTEVTFGRVRIGGAQGYGADASLIPPQFSSMDGVNVTQALEFGEGISLSAGLAVTNGLLNLSQTEDSYGARFNPNGELDGYSNRGFQKRSNKSDRALTFSLTANVKGVDFVAFHGMENNQFLSDEVKASATDPSVVAAKPTVADASHTEVSLGYSGIEGISFGGWYVNYTQGKVKNVDENKGGKLKTTETGTRGYTADTYGLGVMGDSTLFGLTDLLQEGDKLIYSASYAQTAFGVSGSGASDIVSGGTKSFSDLAKDSSTQQYVVGAGYSVGGLTLELNVAQEESAGAKIFGNSKGEKNASTSKTSAYLITYYVF